MKTLDSYLRSLGLLSLGTDLLGCTPSVDDYPAELEEAYCAWQHACHQYERESDCVAAHRIEADPRYEYLRRAVNAGNVEYDRASAAACLDALRERSCEYTDAEPEACEGVFRGRIGRNGPCLSSAECAGNAVCGFDPTCAPDTCCVGACRVFAEPLEIGAPCNFNGGVGCVPEAFCAFDPLTGQPTVCTALVEAGGVCSQGEACVAEARCDGNRCQPVNLRGPGESCAGERDECKEGVCRSRDDGSVVCVVEAELGAPCDQDIGCVRFDTFCDEASGLCTLLPAPGQACTYGSCLPYAQCQYEADEQLSTCVARPGEGDACGFMGTESNYVDCLAPLQCVDDVCKAPEEAPEMSCPVPDAG